MSAGKVLVTGSSGMIGARLCKLLLEKGYEVNGLDVKSDGNKEINFFRASIENEAVLRKCTKGCEYVFHQAAVSSSPMFFPDPQRGIRVNVLGSMKLFSIAREAGVKKVVAASTSSIYGNTPLPSREDMLLVAPNMYAASKQAMETVGLSYTQVTGFPIIFLRYFSVYGLGERRKGNIANMVSQFIWSVLRLPGAARRPVIYGDGTQTRDLIFADDVAEANLKAALSDVKTGIFNIGTGVETSLNEALELICRLAGKKVEPRYVKNPISNYIYRTQADISKAKRELGFKAKTRVDEGIRAILDELKPR
ncbi:MAG: NAD-dependent epimerase/dehydratase family protein [Methanomassiliicoccales archaeon]